MAMNRSTCDRATNAPVPTQEKQVCSSWSGRTPENERDCSSLERSLDLLTEEAPLECVHSGRALVSAHYHWAFRITTELRIHGS